MAVRTQCAELFRQHYRQGLVSFGRFVFSGWFICVHLNPSPFRLLRDIAREAIVLWAGIDSDM